jgi:hypothetical protein
MPFLSQKWEITISGFRVSSSPLAFLFALILLRSLSAAGFSIALGLHWIVELCLLFPEAVVRVGDIGEFRRAAFG